MSYKSLLFCADEKAARLVTQVLSELDFTVELAVDTYATAKKLADEHFDALVVDCNNEQDASLLFKAARNSTENHSSLSVAVVEGQAGVAKAFRIGANLVLTKPVNVEQSKSTLRVARGLLKKNQAKTAAPEGTTASTFAPAPAKPRAPSTPSFNASASSLPSAFTPVPATAAAAHASTPNVPYAGLELEKEPTPVPEAADVAVLESLPQLPKAKASEPVAPPFKAIDKPFVVGGSAAAAAPAMEKKVVERHAGGFSPLVTNEPIIREASSPVVHEMHAVPTFSTLDSRAKGSSGGKGFLKLLAGLAVLGVAFYFGWQKLPALLHRNHTATQASAAQASSPGKTDVAAQQPDVSTQASATQQAGPNVASSANDSGMTSAPTEQITAAPTSSTQAESAPNNIQLQEMPFSRDAKVTVTPKAQPLIVKNDSAKSIQRQSAATPAAPSLDMTAAASSSPIADLITSSAPLPNPAPGKIRISQGVSQGLLIKKIAPSYPSVAIQMHKEGTVEMLATVSKEGYITNMRVLSGDSILARAAMDAVRQWRYRPYLLNGQPLEVETQISLSFKLPR